MRIWAAVAALGATAVAGCAAGVRTPANDPGTDLLRTAQRATAETDYQGLMENQTRTAQGWLRTQIAAYFRKPGLSRMDYQDGPLAGLVSVEGPDFAWRYEPRLRHVMVVRASGLTRAQRQIVIGPNYHTVVHPGGRLAGRNVLEVDVAANRQGIPWRRFWIDSETHVLLGWERFGGSSRPLTLTEFKTVEFKAPPATLFRPPARLAAYQGPVVASPLPISQVQKQVGLTLVNPGWLPAGYHAETVDGQKVGYVTHCEDGCGAAVAETRFTDGVDTVTLFQSPHVMDSADGVCEARNMGAVREVRIVRNNADYIVDGDLDTRQLERIAMSLPHLHASAADTFAPKPAPARAGAARKAPAAVSPAP